ncbi:btk-binding protein-related [Anaeramoeba flamelloides]|uniref:Btk-binding protein-related n=1 Tax=Anaeramoeba flamelloides TaxID=1746091 RepID=A0AAV7Z2Y0_9EUKA|nr:btk-binding protein-related [Anaeramoeba flamelloides]
MSSLSSEKQTTKKESKVLFTKCGRLGFLDKENKPNYKWAQTTSFVNPKKIVPIDRGYVLVWGQNNQLTLHHKDLGTIHYQLPKERIKDIQCGTFSYLILTWSGKVFSLAQENRCSNIPFQNYKKSNFKTLRQVTIDTKENVLIEHIAMGFCNNYFISTDSRLYSSGDFCEGRLGNDIKQNAQIPIFIRKNVLKAFSGPHGLGLFVVTTDNKLLVCGNNSSSKLSLGKQFSKNHQKGLRKAKVEGFEPKDIVNLITGQSQSVLLTKHGAVFSCGSGEYNGHSTKKYIFTEIAELKNKFVIRINSGEYNQLALTKELELFAWGFTYQPTDINISYQKPVKIKLPDFPITKNLQFSCSNSSVFVYNANEDILHVDFENFFKSKLYTDCILGVNENSVKCHKILIEFRMNNIKIQTIQEIMKEKTKNEINNFLKFIYYDQINDENSLKEIFDKLNLTFSPHENEDSLEKDLLKLYNDEDSKDFNILVKSEDEEENDDDDDVDDDVDEIPVHKFILLARSGLFREMFKNLNENEKTINQIKDYSGKSIESLEVLMKYFYTGKIELTADHDPVLIKEELEDSVDYYQLNENSNLIDQLINY